MKRVAVFLLLAAFGLNLFAQQDNPLRVFIRSGPKTHGPGEHDHPQFMEDWVKLLNERGAKATGKMGFPTAEELENTDVLVMYLAEGGTITGEDRANLESFLARGGGIVTLHDAVCGSDPQWFKTVVGGAWEHGHSKWHEGEVGLYFMDTEHPITRGISNFDFEDEIYFDLHMMPEAKVLASSFHSVFVIAPQVWVYEKDNYRSFVCLQGHNSASFELPHFRALLLRGIAWAGKRENVDLLCSKEELASLKYPEGGPTAPEEADEKLIVHPEFEINLVASEPLIEKAISLDWDPQGRLWVAETPEYPGGRTINENDAVVAQWALEDGDTVPSGEKVARPGKDRVSWLEDTDGDGVMDKKHVFAEGLELVTSLVFYKEGVIVTQAPEILWLRDTDGDGKCNMEDERVVLYKGFGTFDTHAVINNMRWGMDGWIYSAIGYSAGSPVSGDGSESFGRVTAGIIRFKPDGSALEQVASGSCNTWGFDFAPDGEAFYTTATCGEHFLHIVMPEKILARGNIGGVRASAVIPDHQEIKPAVHHTRPAYVQIDWVGRFTAAAGCAIYNGGAWPERFNNSHFCSETTMSLVHHELLTPKGVTYVASKEPGREDTEFIAGTDLWFRPVHTRVGPDGALYVIDFYNQAAIHNDTRGPDHGANNAAVRPDRDHHFGRIWRVQHKEANPSDWEIDPEDPAGLVKALDHPNGWVRMTAQRLLMEQGNEEVLPALRRLANSEEASDYGRVHALWTAWHISGEHDPETMTALYTSGSETLAKAVMQLIRNYPLPPGAAGFGKLFAAMAGQLDNQGRLRLETIMAMAALEMGDSRAPARLRASVWDAYPTLNDPWTESALVAILAENPERAILEAAGKPETALYARTVSELAERIAAKDNPEIAAQLLVRLAEKPASANPLKRAVLESFTRELDEDAAVQWTPELHEAFASFLRSGNADLQGAALPLIARWDTESTLRDDLGVVIGPMLEQLNNENLPEDQRAQIAENLIGVRRVSPDILPAVLELVGGDTPEGLQREVLEALGNTSDPGIGKALVEKYPSLPYRLREAAFGQIIRRPEWTAALLDAIEAQKIGLPSLGPTGIHRLRTHADRRIASRALEVIEEIRGPQIAQKDAIIEQLLSVVQQRGNIENGKAVFTQNCANCHKFKGEGSDLAPDLTGMGAHGAHDLLVHIIDPNRVVEPNFVTVSVETKDEFSYDGVVLRENRRNLVLRNANGEYEISQDDIVSRRSSGLSLMPAGFEALGAENLRDLISYISADDNRFRILDLSEAYTADSTQGIYNSRESRNESLRFRKFGMTTIEGIPFDIVAPTRTKSGKNLIVLKGGYNYSKTYPQKVEIPVGVRAGKLHFLGGVGGWAYPCCGEDKNENMPVVKVTVHYRDNATEEIILRNGVEFADYNGNYDVPGSEEAPGLVRGGQVRWFTKSLPREDYIEKITISSYDNSVAPTIVAITAEASVGLSQRAEASGAGQAGASASGPIKTLIVGGGSSHDFGKWFNEVDSKTLERGGLAEVEYTEDLDSVPEKLEEADVLYLCTNQPMENEETRQAIFDFANAGKGLVLVHPGLWYNWRNWPEYNRELVAGGSRGHDRYGEFTVEIVDASHPVVRGVPQKFQIRDELYHHRVDPDGSEIHLLARGHAPGEEKSYPQLWITQHPKARIVCFTLGHDGAAHNSEPYQTILRNAVRWAAGK